MIVQHSPSLVPNHAQVQGLLVIRPIDGYGELCGGDTVANPAPTTTRPAGGLPYRGRWPGCTCAARIGIEHRGHMTYTLLQGSFVIRYGDAPRQGPEPDGDTVKFLPDQPALVDQLPRDSGHPARINAHGVSIRLEAIDALETHYRRYSPGASRR